MGDPVFILGTGRCGSTLVQEICSRHPDVAFVSNLEDRVGALRVTDRWNNPVYRRTKPAWTTKGRVRFAPSEGYHALDREVSPILSAPFRDLTAADATPWLTERLRHFVSRRVAAQQRPVFVHKFTGWPRARLLAAVFPGARFVHVVRDGRAVANSLLQMPWWAGFGGPHLGDLPETYRTEWETSGRSFALLAGIEWKILIDAHAEARDALEPACWLQIRYEDLLGEPRRVFESILRHAGLSWNPQFEAGFAQHRFDSGRADAFRRDLDTCSIELLERSLADHLSQFGYT